MIHGGMKPRERKQVMKRIKNLDFQFVVATDLAARGIDIQGVSDVINDDIPTEDLEFFIHRVGRTGRNGMSGTSITLYSPDEEKAVEELEDMGIHFKPKALKMVKSWIPTIGTDERPTARSMISLTQP